ncbi:MULTISPECIES: hypothetical protein [Pseudomonas]|jgi:hypothetical protein|uniref:hypothetical protein n=1 Tax=Pseudomonas TaxID=286 RepID=UPI000F04C2DE|nr:MULTISPECIES: hypothetical protein [Pseudomonas]MBK5441020.1 hypothetical protein [Pseudomonas sp. TH32]MDF3200034.1 hypothetical protein [Pseudomonas sp. 1912-s]QJI34552.1 hypothetical protein HKK54_09045 [Pseudomonas sp. ADAK13]WDU62003.1 hypothetical protein LRS56_25030 [Pseudomonas poae]
MRKNEPWWVAVYLPCACALALVLMCAFFHIAGYWLSGGDDIVALLKAFLPFYLQMAGAGFVMGLVLWFFNVR